MTEYYLLDKHRAIIQKVVAWAFSNDIKMEKVEFWMKHIFMHDSKAVVVLVLCLVSYRTYRMPVPSLTMQGAFKIKRYMLWGCGVGGEVGGGCGGRRNFGYK